MGGKPRPFAADAGKMQARRIDEPNHLAQIAARILRFAMGHNLPSMCTNSSVNASGLRKRLASEKVERAGALAPI